MDSNNLPEAGFSFKQITLIESNFKRAIQVGLEPDKIQENISINVGCKVVGAEIRVQFTLNFALENTVSGHNEVDCMIKMVGLFEKTGEASVSDLEKFGKVNGAAMIFSFAREHLASLALKANLGSILLPPINFLKHYQN